MDPSTSGGITSSCKVRARVMKALLRQKVPSLSRKVKETPKANTQNESLVKSNSITLQLILSNRDSGWSGVYTIAPSRIDEREKVPLIFGLFG